MNKSLIYILRILVIICMAILSVTISEAAKFEVGIGIANDITLEEPLPGLTDGFGYMFSGTLILKFPVTISIGVIGTRHEFDGGEDQNRLVRADSRRNGIFLQANYQFLKLKKTEFSIGIGLTSVNINGGDADSGSYIGTDYDMENFGYSGTGQWFGFDIHHHIQSNYFVIFGLKYNFLDYSKHQYEQVIGGQLYDFENSASRNGNSLTAYIGVSFRIDFSRF